MYIGREILDRRYEKIRDMILSGTVDENKTLGITIAHNYIILAWAKIPISLFRSIGSVAN